MIEDENAGNSQLILKLMKMTVAKSAYFSNLDVLFFLR